MKLDFARRHGRAVRLRRNVQQVLHVQEVPLPNVTSALRARLYIVLALRLLRHRQEPQVLLDGVLAHDETHPPSICAKVTFADPPPHGRHHAGRAEILRREEGEDLRHQIQVVALLPEERQEIHLLPSRVVQGGSRAVPQRRAQAAVAEVQLLRLDLGRGIQLRDAQLAQFTTLRRRYGRAVGRVGSRDHDLRYQDLELPRRVD